MPRGPRLDAPGVLHHVMARGIERGRIFRDDHDRDDFVDRLVALVEDAAVTVYAWALIPNHFHLLVRTGRRPLSRSMRSLLTGYAGAFNRRHGRSGHLFQNRYKSIVCEQDAYFLELVRYLHLNPLRAGLVGDLRELERYRYCGHSALRGMQVCEWQDTETVLVQFGRTPRRAREQYGTFVAEGVHRGRRPELQGGGLVRSVGGWKAVQELRRGRESYRGDERILGSSEFVDSVQREIEVGQEQAGRQRSGITSQRVIEQVCQAVGVRVEELGGDGRRTAVSQARGGVAYLWIEWLGRSGPPLARALGLHPATVYEVARRGRKEATRWEKLFEGP